jgi:hypothetical protein
MIAQDMHTGALHGREGVGDITGPLEIRVLIEIVDPIPQLDDEVRPSGVDPIHEWPEEIQRCGAQFRPLVHAVVNIGDECNPQGVCHRFSYEKSSSRAE